MIAAAKDFIFLLSHFPVHMKLCETGEREERRYALKVFGVVCARIENACRASWWLRPPLRAHTTQDLVVHDFIISFSSSPISTKTKE